MTALSLVFYVPVNKLTPKLGKKKMILFAFAVFSLAYFYTGFMGKMSFIPETVQGLILTVVAALPMAIFGICPRRLWQISPRVIPSHPEATGRNVLCGKNLCIQTGPESFHADLYCCFYDWSRRGTGYRIAAFGAAVFCMVGGIILVFYNEKKINGIIGDSNKVLRLS